MKVTEKRFNDAHARFKVADAEVASLQARLTDANTKRLEAAMSIASADRELESFATSADLNPASASKLVARRAQAHDMTELLDKAIEHLTKEVARSKADVILAEKACIKAQDEYHNAALAELVNDFLRTNSGAIQKLTQTMHLASLFSSVNSHGELGRSYAARHPEQFLQDVLPSVFAEQLANDEKFREGCQLSGKSPPIAQVLASANVTNAERAAAAATAANGRDSMAQALIPHVEETAPFDMRFATTSARSAEQSAQHHRQRASTYRESLVRRPDDESIKQSIKDHEKEAARFDGIVSHWNEAIQSQRIAA